jgi:parvulin-like peptidyl-prolyl isomerase
MALACTTVIGISACGSADSGTRASIRSVTTHPAAATQSVAASKAAERVVVVRVGATAITKATFDHWRSVLTPRTASYEPRSRAACSAVRASIEVLAPKKVNGHAPTTAELQRQCRQENDERVKQHVLQTLISSYWVIQEAAQIGLPVSDKEVTRQIEEDKHKQFASEAEFQKYQRESRRTDADLHLAIKRHLAEAKLRERVKHRVGELSPDQIAAYYNAHKDKYVVPERRDIEAIRTWTRPVIEQAMREVRAGVSFGAIARRVSIDHPSSEHGGVTLGVVRGQEESGFDGAIFAAKPHVLTGPLHLRKRYYIFEVNKTYPARQTPFAQIESSIAQTLSTERQNRAIAHFIGAWRRKWIAKTSCSPGYVVSKCKQYKASGAPPVEEDPYTFN